VAKATEAAPPGHDPAAVPACEASLGSAFGLLGKRWNGVILGVLGGGALGFADLRRGVGSITDSVLSDRLTELAGAGLVRRTVTDARPPGVRYELTSSGAALEPILGQLAAWAGKHLESGGGC
jgi:DNA-binding HxlR family transcriptional regulator